MHGSTVVRQIEGTVASYMRGESSLRKAQSAAANPLKVLIAGIARDVRDAYGDTVTDRSGAEQERRERSVFAQLIIGAERRARDDGGSLAADEIEKLLRLMCWMSEAAKELRPYRSPPSTLEAA